MVYVRMTTTGKILVADDDAYFRRLACAVLRRAGFECLEAENSAEVMALVRKEKCAVVVCDILMAGNVHLELVRDLAAHGGAPSIVLVTAYPSTETAIEALHLSVAAYLVKPISPEQLLGTVQRAVEREQLLERLVAEQARLAALTRDAQRLQSLGTDARDPAKMFRGFLEMQISNVLGSLAELKSLVEWARKRGSPGVFSQAIEQCHPARLLDPFDSTVQALRMAAGEHKDDEARKVVAGTGTSAPVQPQRDPSAGLPCPGHQSEGGS